MEDVKQEEAETSTESTEENEQDSNDSEVVETQESDEVEKAKRLAENYKRAMQQERERRKAAEAQLKPAQQPVQAQVSQDDTYKRFLRTEADAKVARLMATDPTFKDRIDMVEEYVEKGYDITTADMMAKARIMDLISAESKKQEAIEQKKLINLKSSASAEEEAVSPPNYKDLLAGKFDDNPEAKMVRQAMERFK